MRYCVGAQDPPEIAAEMARFSGEYAVDVGANGGRTAEILLKRFRHVYAFEPVYNKRLDDLGLKFPQLHIVRLACGARAGDMSARYRHDGQVSRDDGKPVVIQVLPLDTFFFDAWIMPTLIKIDVEGFEVEVAQGATRLVNRRKTALFIEVHRKDYGEFLPGLFPFLKWRVLRHPSYRSNSYDYRNHYWLVGEP